MATLRELIIKVSANSQSFQTEIARASRMGADYYKTMQNGGRQAAAAAKESQKALSELTDGFASAGRAATAAAAAFATGKLVQIADQWNSVNARLKQASVSSNDFTLSQTRLMAISQSTGTAFTDNANLFSRAAASMREFGYSSDEVLKITEAVSTGLKLSGASTEEAGSVITQFSQALAQGVLRGEEFNAVNEAGDRVIRALAAGMGVARKDLKAMADQGQLTIDKVVPALISQLGVLQGEFSALPPTVSGSMQKVTNSFMAWVGGVSQATGATDALSGGLDGLAKTLDSLTSSAVSGALSDVADNMSLVTTAAGGLVGIGLARYLGGIVTSASSATGALISAAKSEVALAVAQEKAAQSSVAASRAAVYRAQQALQGAKSADVQAAQQERVAAAEARVTAAQGRLTTALATGTAAEKVRARTALERAQAGLVAAKNADAQAIAERKLAAAQSALGRNIAGRVSAQNNLNSVTSVGTRLMSGALGLIGGIPGLVMLGAGAWYAVYQNQEQARKSAQEYASTIQEVSDRSKAMTLTEASDNEDKARKSLNEQNRLISEQSSKVKALKEDIAGYQYMLANRGPTTSGGFMINHLTSVEAATKGLASATESLAVEQERLTQLQAKAQEIQQVLEGLENRRVALIRQQAAEQNAAYQSLIMMNGQHTEFNRLLGLGNNLLMARQGLVNAPMRMPQADLTSQQTNAIEKSRRDLALSKLKGEEKEKARLGYAADDLGLTTAPQFQTGRQELINNGLAEWRNNEANKPKRKGPKTDEEKAEDVYKRLLKQQREQIALESQNTELAKVKYQVTQGELHTLEQSKKETLLHNAALIDQKNIAEQLKTFRDGLADSNAAARDRGNIDFLGAGMGNKARDRMKEMADIRSDFLKQQRDLQRDFSKGQISEDLYKQQTEALQVALTERLQIQEEYYKKTDEQQSDWRAGISDSLMNYADQASDLSSMSASATSEILNNATNSISTNMTNVLTGATTFKEGMSNIFTSLGESVIQSLIQMATQALITKAILASVGGGFGGIFGSIFGGASGAASSGTAIQSAGANFSFNALGGVYDSPSLSAYSGGVYNTPQYFAFAKGAGVFGEAGPEAIMPLTRGADGSLGVKAVGRESPAVQNAAKQIQAQPRIAVSVDARSTFTGKPDDITMQAIERRNDALEQRIVNTLTAEVNNPQKKFGRAIYSNLQSKKPR
ncbi:phage tail tape measure protein [Klebsiella quasipneumoniae]|uniref:phage tail tape measure protein n=1 Tax=Klebsiella quasipneumoniae TaxID=1463165 RepID=UPI000B41B4FA|nr:phage tail tape measure protein [Klebsiella quasipneumoniae]AZJ05116.1 phage tail tape measure protein [Klebsiella quasipneumoniae]AZJ28114.1 phage tail tape measure protein [Klebsiella quasipneumoniae subsp. similipneumoniae]OVW21798.1 phage tail tape measure protein [Klebsiella quasipneumoniae subsp. similipneumoniae]OVW23403.1 phage tail tape measure protein [Klebsiella quasipneumoniae subsp. similipneumoniae]